MLQRCSLYLVSPPQFDLKSFLRPLEETLATYAAKAFQLRLKNAKDEEIIAAAKVIMPICHKYEAAFIINDRADLAAECNADGVHLGQEDMGVTEARKILGPRRVIGVSCHASKDMAMRAGEAGADYVAFGAFFPTKSKPQEKVEKWGVPTPEIIEWWTTFTTLPCVAIGGITPQNCAPLVKAGADFLGVITSVWDYPQGPAWAAKEFAVRIKQQTYLD